MTDHASLLRQDQVNGNAARAIAARGNPGLPLNLIRIDGGTQSRAMLQQGAIDEYAAEVRSGAEFPPVVVFYDGSDHWLADGFHRLNAYTKAGAEFIPADVRQGTRRDAILHSVGANGEHGLRRTNDDKRRAVLTLLNDGEWSKWSDREIARQCNVSHEFVRRARPVTVNVDSERTYTTKHGKIATMDTSAIGRTAPKQTEDDDTEVTSSMKIGPKINVPEGHDLVDLIRRGLAMEREGGTVPRVAKEIGLSGRAYGVGRMIILLMENKNLSPADAEIVKAALAALSIDMQLGRAQKLVEPVANKVWGEGRGGGVRSIEGRRLERFEHAFGIVMQVCLTTDEIDIPYLSADRAEKAVEQISAGRAALLLFAQRIKEIHG